MEPIKPLPYGENCDYNEEEKKVWQQCLDAGLDGEEVNTVLSYTAVLQTIRGKWDEKNRVQTTKDYFKLMVVSNPNLTQNYITSSNSLAARFARFQRTTEQRLTATRSSMRRMRTSTFSIR